MKLGDVSMLAGAVTGEGRTADLMADGTMGALPRAFMKDARRRKDKANQANEVGMKKGGKVKKYAKGGKVRGCGIAKRGVRKAKMR